MKSADCDFAFTIFNFKGSPRHNMPPTQILPAARVMDTTWQFFVARIVNNNDNSNNNDDNN